MLGPCVEIAFSSYKRCSMPLSIMYHVCLKLVVCCFLWEKLFALIQFVCFGWQNGNLKEKAFGEIDPSFICLVVCLFFNNLGAQYQPFLLPNCGNILGKSTWRKFLVYLKSTLYPWIPCLFRRDITYTQWIFNFFFGWIFWCF